jgi:putative flavoprotein involved in K+ transport
VAGRGRVHGPAARRPARPAGRARRARRPVDLDPPTSVDLRAERVGGVVWCTGFDGDFSFIDPALVAADGAPCRRDAAGPVPGLWYLGLRWLRRRSSGILFGFPGDAAVVADAVRAHLGG